jgi:hypothetical protein
VTIKILNREKTHFMRQDECGACKVKFGKVDEVYAVINNILNSVSPKKIDDSLCIEANDLIE